MKFWKILSILILFSCNETKYKMTNMLPETIDVTNYIKSGEFTPDSCEGRIDRLIRTKPFVLDKNYEEKLQKCLKKWKNEYNNWLIKNNQDTISMKISDIHNKTSYQYSYFITDEPIDVYRTETELSIKNNEKFKLFIRLRENGKIFYPYKEDGWIINNCDEANSVIPDLYKVK